AQVTTGGPGARSAASAAAPVLSSPEWANAWLPELAARAAANEGPSGPLRSSHPSEEAAQAVLLRDIIGDPFHPPSPVSAAWLAWNGSAVRKVAECIYAENAFDRLGILADALEEAGCADAELLGHLRGPGPHVKGCWAVDAVLVRS